MSFKKLLFLAAISCTHASELSSNCGGQQPVFKPYDLNLPCWRIPSAVRAGERLFVFAEGRSTKGDGCFDSQAPGGIYHRAIYFRYSDDDGQTWSNITLLAGNQSEEGRVADPQAVYDEVAKVIIVQYRSQDGVSTWQVTSSDLGATWDAPRSLDTFLGAAYSGFSCPGVGVQLVAPAPHVNRLVFSVYGTANGVDGTGFTAVAYSDDHGKTYKLAEVPGGFQNTSFTGTDETQVVQMADGRLLMSMRNSGDVPWKRRAAVSLDGGATWIEHGTGRAALPAGAELPGGTCQSSLLLANGSAFYSLPYAADQGRSHMTVIRSDDNAGSWPRGALVYSGPSAYSCLVAGPSGSDRIGLFYERDWEGCGESCSIFYASMTWNLPNFKPPVPMTAVLV